MSIQAALDKIEFLWRGGFNANYPNWGELNSIFLALKEPDDDKQMQNKYPSIRVEITNINRRIGELENKFGSKNPKKEILMMVGQLEQRLERLEKRIDECVTEINNTNNIIGYNSTHITPLEKPSECKHLWNGTLKGLRCIYCGVEKPSKPSECISIDRKIAEEWYKAQSTGSQKVTNVESMWMAIDKALGKGK